MKWARAHGFRWSEQVCKDAVSLGDVDMLKWARDNACPWSENTSDLAKQYEYVEKGEFQRVKPIAL